MRRDVVEVGEAMAEHLRAMRALQASAGRAEYLEVEAPAFFTEAARRALDGWDGYPCPVGSLLVCRALASRLEVARRFRGYLLDTAQDTYRAHVGELFEAADAAALQAWEAHRDLLLRRRVEQLGQPLFEEVV